MDQYILHELFKYKFRCTADIPGDVAKCCMYASLDEILEAVKGSQPSYCVRNSSRDRPLRETRSGVGLYGKDPSGSGWSIDDIATLWSSKKSGYRREMRRRDLEDEIVRSCRDCEELTFGCGVGCENPNPRPDLGTAYGLVQCARLPPPAS